MSIKDFDIIQELGKGAFGTVYKVRRIKDNQIYALKKVIMNKLKQKEKENSLNEIRILASINHQNIVAYKDAFYDQELYSLCIVTEFADDGDLEKKINEHIKKKTQISETQIFSIFIQILNGLKSLHDQKIMHRDIKAANMLLFKDGFVKIGDMNVSKVIKNGLMNTQTGTPYYASPEVWNNKPYDCKSDIWSLGCLLYEMTTLKAPFRGNSMKNLFDKVMKGTYDPISSFYSKSLSEIIKSMLMLNSQLRPDCDTILKMICKKVDLSFNFPLEYEANANGLNYFKNFKNEINVKNQKENKINIDCGIRNNKAFEEKMKNELLQTIKIPKKLNEINNMLPKSNYRKNIISTSINYGSNTKYNDISLPNVLNKSANENNLSISREININKNASKIIKDLRNNYRPISSDNQYKDFERSQINKINDRKYNLDAGQNYQKINPNINNYNINNFNKRNIPHLNNGLRNGSNNKNPIIVNQISSKIDRINIVNCNVDLLEKLANLNKMSNNDNIQENNENNINNQNNNNKLESSFNKNPQLNNENINTVNKSLSSLSPLRNNLGNFYMRKNIDKITSLQIQTNEDLLQKELTRKMYNNSNDLEKNCDDLSNKNIDQILKTENNIQSQDKSNIKKVLDQINLNLENNIRLKRVPSKNFESVNYEEIKNSIKHNDQNNILNKNFLNEYIPFNAKSTKNKNKMNFYANRKLIVSAEKTNDINNVQQPDINKEEEDNEVQYMNTDINNVENLKKKNSIIYQNKNYIDAPVKNKFNNIKIDLENSKKELNDVEISSNQIQTDLDQKSKSSLVREVEENIISSNSYFLQFLGLSKSSKKVVTNNLILSNKNKHNLIPKNNEEITMDKTIITPLNEYSSSNNSQKRINSAIRIHNKNNSNNIKMLLNPCLIDDENLSNFNRRPTKNDNLEKENLNSTEKIKSSNEDISLLKRVRTTEDNKSNIEEIYHQNIKKEEIDYNNIKINNQYNVNNLFKEAENNKIEIRNRINSANQKMPASVVEQHNIRANYLKNQIKLKKNLHLINSAEKSKNKEDFPTVNNSKSHSREVTSNLSKEKKNIQPKFIQLSNKNNKNSNQENNLKINIPRTPNALSVKKIDLNLESEKNQAKYNFSTKHVHNQKIAMNRDSPNISTINKIKLQENLKNISQEKSLFANKLNNKSIENKALNSNNVKNENDFSFFGNKDIEFNNSKMDNFEYSFMENKSKHTSQNKLETPNIQSNNYSINKSSNLIKSEDNSNIIKNVDNIYSTYENYDDGNSLKKDNKALPKIPKYYGSNVNTENKIKKLKINLPHLKKDSIKNFNYDLSPNNNLNYITNSKDRFVNLSTNDNLITNPDNNYLNTSCNNRRNIIDKNNKYSPINAGLPITNFYSKNTPSNIYSKNKKIVYVQSNQ